MLEGLKGEKKKEGKGKISSCQRWEVVFQCDSAYFWGILLAPLIGGESGLAREHPQKLEKGC